jgi:Lysylphosphatidylglycerol synthase TM region
MKKSHRSIRSLASIASLALFVYVLERSGPAAVFNEVLLLGWGFAALILLSGLGHILGSAAWSYCVQTRKQRPRWVELFGPRLMGEALDDLTPAGPLLGETAKVAVVSRLIPGEAGASSVVIENLIDALAGLLFILSGLVLALLKVTTPQRFRWIGGELAIGSLVAIALAVWIFRRRLLLVGRALEYLKRVKVARALIESHGHYLRELERDILAFFLTHKGLFLGVLMLEIASNFSGIAETYLILKIAAGHPSFVAAYLLESANRAVQLAFSFVPFGVGIEEAAAAATVQVFGYPGSEGVSLAVIRKIRSLFWAALGLLLAAKYSISRPAAKESRIRP